MIKELLEKYTTLQRIKLTPKGVKLLCPYHDDSHPSFSIHEEKGYAKCFVCKEFRSLFSFLIEHGVPLAEAIHYQFNFVPNHEAGQNDEMRDYTLGYFLPQSMLDRGFTPETLDFFRVGFDPHANFGRGYTTVPMVCPEVSTAVYGIKYREYPKNFWYSTDFRKEQFIYNYAPTKERYYVEGETDTWNVWQLGTKNVSAILGSEVTEAQAELMMQHENVFLAFDPDKAGWSGIYTAYRWLRMTNVNVFVVMVRADDAGAATAAQWARSIATPKPILEFIMEFARRFPDWHRDWATWENGSSLLV